MVSSMLGASLAILGPQYIPKLKQRLLNPDGFSAVELLNLVQDPQADQEIRGSSIDGLVKKATHATPEGFFARTTLRQLAFYEEIKAGDSDGEVLYLSKGYVPNKETIAHAKKALQLTA